MNLSSWCRSVARWSCAVVIGALAIVGASTAPAQMGGFGGANFRSPLSSGEVDRMIETLGLDESQASLVKSLYEGFSESYEAASEEARDRAVAVTTLVGAAIPVRFAPSLPLDGFEAAPEGSRTPDRLTIAIGSEKQVVLLSSESVGSLRVSPEGIVSVQPVRPPFLRTISVLARGEGSAFVAALDASGTILLARLLVVVKPVLEHTIAFHVVRDSAGHASTRGSASIARIHAVTNDLYFRQAAVRFAWDGVVHVVTVARDLGEKVTSRQGNPSEEWNAVVASGAGARFRVFFVHDFDFEDSEKEELGGADHIPGRDSLVGDDTPANLEEKAVAHEVGHTLGLVHTGPDQLMGTSRTIVGLRISAAEADRINPGRTPRLPPTVLL
ncbi:hypothetical protein FBQ97_16655 [Acidobacteria bacterium ACD]|nr:hypothetical protein [Acidobacteria bacterium ACD]